MTDFKVGDKVMLEGVIAQDSGDVILMAFDGAPQWMLHGVAAEVMAHAKLIRPEHDIEAHTHIPACKGTNCGSTTGMNHSPEYEAEYVAAITGLPSEEEVLDLNKPIRDIGLPDEKVASIFGPNTRDFYIVEFEGGLVDLRRGYELENIPEPMRILSREVFMVEGLDFLVMEGGATAYRKILARGTITLTEGDGMEDAK